MIKKAVYLVSKLYYDAVIPSVKSLLMNSGVDEVYLLTEGKYPNTLPENVKVINAQKLKKEYLDQKGANIRKSKYTYLPLLRCAYAKIFPDDSRILSLDADTIVVDDMGSELWTMDMCGNYDAGVIEQKLSRKKRTNYINAGVMVFDLDKIREDKKDDEMIEAINTTDYYWLEQDCINEKCAGRIKVIPRIYNASQFTGISKKTLLRHFAYEHNWTEYDVVKHYAGIPWEEVMKVWGNK